MKFYKLLSSLSLLFVSVTALADVRMNQQSYIKCNSCQSNYDFKQAAINHHMNLFPANSANYRSIDSYVVVNLMSHKAVKVKLVRRYQSGIWAGSSVFSHLEASTSALSWGDTQKFNEYLNADSFKFVLGESSYSQEVNTFYVGEVSFYKWQASTSTAHSEINSLVLAANLNPFFFIESDMKVQVRTKERAGVYFLNTNFDDQYQWEVAFTQPQWDSSFYDQFGNAINSNANHTADMECFVGYTIDLCRIFSSYTKKDGSTGGSFIGDIHKVGRGVGPLPPPRCMPGSPMCPASQ
ncbi:MAG: hypothetical protein HWE27_05040 [Gammaproteobacteria bacterium]|nr:hypothetical protein [Gammaproteobacteria bacterium]